MKALLLLPYYEHWHYGQALLSFIAIVRNLMWFSGHLFSVQLLLSTLFSPWQRVQETRKEGEFNLTDILFTFITNMLLRLAGAMIRLAVIFVGLVLMAAIFCIGSVLFVVWLTFPLAMVVFVSIGIMFSLA